MKFKKGDTVIYPQHGACIVVGTKKMEAFGETQEYLILQDGHQRDDAVGADVEGRGGRGAAAGQRPTSSKTSCRCCPRPTRGCPSNWSRRFKNHQEKLKSGDVYQVAEVVRNLAARNRDASLSAAERTMYDRARINLISEIAPALKVSAEEAETVPRRGARSRRAQAGQGAGEEEGLSARAWPSVGGPRAEAQRRLGVLLEGVGQPAGACGRWRRSISPASAACPPPG